MPHKSWEYLVKTSGNVTGETTQESMDFIGKNGWELVGVTYREPTQTTTLFFKRERLTK